MKFFVFATLVSATVSAYTIRRQASSASTPLPPSEDPWYSAPAGFESATPGTVFKVRNASALVPLISGSRAAYQMLYRTTDSRYRPTFAVSTLLLPSVAATNGTKAHQLLSYGVPYDSAFIDASPSYALYSGGSAFGNSDVIAALKLGFAVLIADYEGPLASFTAGVMSGHATLDSVRGVFACPEFGMSMNNTSAALWGYSGGALASEWALELQVQYAPELQFAGAALGGLTPNVSSVLLTINGTVYAGLAPSGILGLSSQHPDAYDYLQSQLNPTGEFNASRFNAARNYTLIQSIGAFAGQDIGKYFVNGFETVESPIAQHIINIDGTMGYHGVPAFPLFVYKAIGDDISVIADTDALVDRYCAVGATIDYQRNTVGNHASEGVNGEARALAFLKSALSGTYSATGCSIKNVTVLA